MLDYNKVLDLINRNDYTSTRQICEAFDISESTARRALERLYLQGRITRMHGGAMPIAQNNLTPEFKLRNSLNKQKKIAIAEEASKIIEQYSTIILMGGTTVCEMCPFIENMNITVITNSILVLNGLKYSRNVRLILLGGLYNYQEEEVGGLLANKGLSAMRADYLFMGASGFDETYGFSTTNAALDLYMSCIEACINVCVLADSSKYMKGGASVTAATQQVNYLFTDDGLDPRARRAMEEKGITVNAAELSPRQP